MCIVRGISSAIGLPILDVSENITTLNTCITLAVLFSVCCGGGPLVISAIKIMKTIDEADKALATIHSIGQLFQNFLSEEPICKMDGGILPISKIF